MIKTRKSIEKIIILLVFLFSIFCLVPNISRAEAEAKKPSFSSFWESGKSFVTHGSIEESKVSTDTFSTQIIPLIKFMSLIAFIGLIIAVLVIGIKYMLASATDKAELKKKLVGLALGAVVIFMSYTIWLFVYNIMQEMD